MRAGICTKIWDGVEFHCNVGWMRRHGVRGVVIWPRIMFSDRAENIPRWVFRHELEHAYQVMREGPIRFYLKFFWYSIRYGYKNNPYEVEAREHQYNELTDNEEQILWKLKEISLRSQSG